MQLQASCASPRTQDGAECNCSVRYDLIFGLPKLRVPSGSLLASSICQRHLVYGYGGSVNYIRTITSYMQMDEM